ncbi:MAG: hypothetical protein J6R42_03350 [Clostridia bacterium]|nr:hypothetical protein [Clostridia bacterium]
MTYIIDNDLHIHTKLSICSRDEEQTNQAILDYAKENHITTVCVADHFWERRVPRKGLPFYDEQDYDYIKQGLPLPQAEGVRFLFGGETDMDITCTLGATRECADELDFLVVPTTHLHMVLAPSEGLDVRAYEYVRRLAALLEKDLPFHKVGLAHATCNLMAPVGDDGKRNSAKVLERVPVFELYELFRQVARCGMGVELNFNPFIYSEQDLDTVLRTYRIAKECGCLFYFASDAHHPKDFEKVKVSFPEIVRLLDLKESDKFLLS